MWGANLGEREGFCLVWEGSHVTGAHSGLQ